MEQASISKASLRGRLIAIGALRGAVLWYAIEKLFETHIGLSAQQIVLVGVLAQGSKIVFELPTSIVADRWSRRKLLLVAQAAMVMCSVMLGLSNGVLTYCLGIVVWSLSDALSSGVYEAFAYDSMEAAGLGNDVRKVYARMRSAQFLSMGVAGVAAGSLSLYYSLRWSYFVTVLPALATGLLMARLPEKPRERNVAGSGLKGHIGAALRTLWAPKLRWAAALYVCFMGLLSIWYEYYQLLGIDVHLSSFWFSVLITVATLGMVVGAEVARYRRGTASMISIVWMIMLGVHLGGLRLHNAFAVFGNVFLLFAAFMLLQIYLELYVQSIIGSKQRATILSVMTTLGYVCFFALAAVFVAVLHWLGIRGALTVASLPLLLLGVVDLLRGIPWALGKRSPELLGEELLER